jgi:hypothetical protein
MTVWCNNTTLLLPAQCGEEEKRERERERVVGLKAAGDVEVCLL